MKTEHVESLSLFSTSEISMMCIVLFGIVTGLSELSHTYIHDLICHCSSRKAVSLYSQTFP